MKQGLWKVEFVSEICSTKTAFFKEGTAGLELIHNWVQNYVMSRPTSLLNLTGTCDEALALQICNRTQGCLIFLIWWSSLFSVYYGHQFSYMHVDFFFFYVVAKVGIHKMVSSAGPQQQSCRCPAVYHELSLFFHPYVFSSIIFHILYSQNYTEMLGTKALLD